MSDSPIKLLLGFITGIAFGFLLQKGQAAKYRVIMGQCLLKDWTVLKIMLTAVVVGSIGVWALVNFGAATLHIKPAAVGGVLFGGLLFGIGIAIFGLCPGTSVAACGEGHRDAAFGVLGMLFGAGLYVAGYAAWQPIFKAFADWGKLTLPEATGTSPWLWIIGLVLGGALIAWLLEKKGRGGGNTPSRLTSPPAGSAAKRMV